MINLKTRYNIDCVVFGNTESKTIFMITFVIEFLSVALFVADARRLIFATLF